MSVLHYCEQRSGWAKKGETSLAYDKSRCLLTNNTTKSIAALILRLHQREKKEIEWLGESTGGGNQKSEENFYQKKKFWESFDETEN